MNDIDSYFNEQMKDEEFRKEYYRIHYIDDIADQILQLRNKRGLTQKQLAEKAGTIQAVVSRVENSSVAPSLSTIQKLAEALDSIIRIDIVPNEEVIIEEIYTINFDTKRNCQNSQKTFDQNIELYIYKKEASERQDFFGSIGISGTFLDSSYSVSTIAR